MKNYSLIVAFLAISLIFLTACQKNLAGRTQVMLVSESTAISESKLAYNKTIGDLTAAGKVDTDRRTVQRVNRITDLLIQQAIKKRPETQNWEWSVKVIDEPNTINAWCMAGGKMAIYKGLINKLNATDDEIAQVMGHEISHALLNHSAERMSIAMANNLALSMLQKATDAGTQGMTLASAAANIALTLPNSRQGEKDADKIGIELAAKAGFNPNAAVTLWQKMAANSGGGQVEFLSTHPSPENRQEKLRKMIPAMMPYYEAAKSN